MEIRKRSSKHKRRSSPKIKWWNVVVIIGLISAVLFLLERLTSCTPEETVIIRPLPVAPLKQLPPGPADYDQKIYTSVRKAPSEKTGAVYPANGKAIVAIIVDDMGSNLPEAQALLAIHVPLTFSIIPGLPKVKAVAAAATAAGVKVMVHLPMEPQGYPKQRLEENGLLVQHSVEEITTRTAALLAAVPGAVGANNHMGSRFTEQEEKMNPVLRILKERGLYFIDSRTTPNSIGFALAERLGVKTATRNVFLDNEQDIMAIKKQLHAAVQLSLVKGGVIAICHPHQATIQALKEALPELQKSGVKFVTAGELVR